MHRTARESPGSLAEQGLARMEGYLIQNGGGLALTGPNRSVLPPVAQAYLSTVYLPTHPESQIGLRSAREMRTLAMSIDLLLGGHILHGLDVLLQRFKALELAAEQGSWSQARWLELIPTSDVSSWSRDDLRSAMREQDLEVRLGLAPLPKGAGRGRGKGEPGVATSGAESESAPWWGRRRGGKGKGKKGKDHARSAGADQNQGGGSAPPSSAVGAASHQ